MVHAPTEGVIKTDRLELVPLALADAALMVNGHRPPDARWAEDYPTEGSLVAASLTVAATGEGRPFGAFGNYQIIRTTDRLVIGDAGFFGPPDGEGVIHVGAGLSPVERGNGYAAEALSALVAWALEQPGVQHVRTDTALTNEPGIRLLERAGMRRTGADERLVYYEA